MITKRTIKVPIYDYKVIIVVADTWEEAHNLYPGMRGEGRACILEGSDHSIIVIPPHQPEYIVHECVHLKNCIWNYIDYKPMSDNDEVDAYLVEYLFNEVSKVVNKHNLTTHY